MKNITVLIAISLVSIFISCKDSASQKAPEPCDLYEHLNGAFSTSHMEGTMNFSGGMTGTIEIVGVDYNEMTCTYSIVDCTIGTADMNCDGAPYQNTIVMKSKDQVIIGSSKYNRVK